MQHQDSRLYWSNWTMCSVTWGVCRREHLGPFSQSPRMQSDKLLAVVANRQITDSESSFMWYFSLFKCWSLTSSVFDLAAGQPYGPSICCRYVEKTYIIDITPHDKRGNVGDGSWGLLLLHKTTNSKQIFSWSTLTIYWKNGGDDVLICGLFKIIH